jgi:hypothetical protein
MNELNALSEYMDIYIQLLPSVYDKPKILDIVNLPSFEYFKRTMHDERYSLSQPNYKDSKTVIDATICNVHTKGLSAINGIGYRYFNYWKGVKFFTGGNINGNYILCPSQINNELKNMK